MKLLGQWRSIAKEVLDHTAIIAKFLCLLHITDTYVITTTQVYGPSMLPTLNLVGDVLLTERISARIGKVGVGDVVLVRSPENPMRIVTKRVLGMQGDRVTYVVDPRRSERARTIVVPKGHIWIQGDNMYSSRDSRQLGPVPYGLIQGKVFCRVWPLRDFGFLDG
ncbi:unnamed protein product [Rhodiola kirilowii]